MRQLQRHSRWIALAVVIAMASPFLAQGLGALMSIDPGFLTAALLIGTAVMIVSLAWPREDEDRD
ncbi:hypothetical protein [Glycomyces xiaoerkulensis]|uniref:hypothetical protein n=1 Tax=Glycomyces xiaoerkulensis TaxID=2038139 RepID=UPI000C267202|nr:hypothetical protein [Glycomyces xiaoerkulensis]